MAFELVLGARRSGKSRIAEERALALGVQTYVATALDDAVGAERIAEHRRRRGDRFGTLEPRDPAELVQLLRAHPEGLLVDGIGLWVGWQLASGKAVDADGLLEALVARTASTIVVAEEVGWSIHPQGELAQRYVDELGTLTQRMASHARRVSLVVAGIELVLKGDA
jgi:adenosylcobinamide kinase/adenosylcobinamide-phosphate guanylyltransferase